MGSIVLLDLMGGVALLLWGLHMVQSGILRAFGPDLRTLLARALRNRFAAFAAGIGLTALLQSSTATALITSSFTAEGLVSLVPALAIMLGANVGTTLIVQVLSFNISAVAPVLFIIGLVAFRSGARSRIKDIGRVAIGLGLMLLALHILLDTLAPAENAPGMRVFMNAITGDPVLCIMIGAVVTWAVHSSVASVLLIMSLAYAHFITPYAALALVLGANLGSAINPVFEGARRDNPASYRLPVGNLVNRLIGVVVVAPFLGPIALFILWDIVVRAGWIKAILLPTPGATLAALFTGLAGGPLLADFAVTVMRTLEAFLIAAFVGVPLGVLLGSNERAYRSVEFLIDFFRSTPSSALIPLFLLIFVVSDINKVAIAAFGALLIVLFNSAYGVINARKQRVMAAKVMGASRWQIFKDVLIWESLQPTFVGLRSAVSMSLVIVIVAEMFIGSDNGLGHRIIDAQQVLNVKSMYAAILAAGALGYALNILFLIAERKIVHWSGR